MPRNWSCDPDQGLYVCTDSSAPRQKPGVIVFQYGEAGPTDTIEQVRSRLQKPRAIKGKQGVPLLSRVVSIQDKNINGQNWLEALHFESELADYYTYYLATRRGDLQFLMSLSAHNSEWDKYRPMFERTINSLRLFTPKSQPQAQQIRNPPAVNQASGLPQQAGNAPLTLGERFPTMLQGMSRNQWILVGAVILSVLMILYALRKD